ncbi:MAG: hypothetical protein ACO1Q7_17440 [Gemmatimonas sp.]
MSDFIPRELAENVLDYQDRSSTIVVDDTGSNFPSAVDTSGWTVLGHVRRGSANSTTVFRTDRTDLEFAAEVRTRFSAGGFAAEQSPIGGGFTPNEYATMQALQSDQQTAFYDIRRRERSTILVVTIQARDVENERRMCEMDLFNIRAMMPTLLNPKGTHNTGGGGGSSGPVSYTGTSLQPRVAVPFAVDHYTEQLRTAGWNEVSRDIAEESAVLVYRRLDTDGEGWVGTLSIFDDSHRNSLELTFSLCNVRGKSAGRGRRSESFDSTAHAT